MVTNAPRITPIISAMLLSKKIILNIKNEADDTRCVARTGMAPVLW